MERLTWVCLYVELLEEKWGMIFANLIFGENMGFHNVHERISQQHSLPNGSRIRRKCDAKPTGSRASVTSSN